jgi:heptosyltransferase I
MRLSAIGDISHMMPIIHTLQKSWPHCEITWIIGSNEHHLVSDLENINFIIFDKAQKWHAYKLIKQQLKGKKFDVLLHMQMSLRSSFASLFIKAPIKIGFDRKRSHDFQWLFTNHKIKHTPKQHVIDSFFSFLEIMGIKERIMDWSIPIPDKDRLWAKNKIAFQQQKILLIAPCSSMSYRNWTIEGYQTIAKYALSKDMTVVIVGGNNRIEHHYADQIQHACNHLCLNITGQSNLKQLLALISEADVILAPDSGPAHLGTACSTPVIGLYACTNPERARPYLSQNYLVNQYPQAIEAKHKKTVEAMPWGTRVRNEGTMERITIEQVKEQLNKFI